MKKILIVEDDTAILEALELALQDEGFSVHTVTNGNDAVDKAVEVMPDIILLDLLLSGKDGTEIIKQLKQNNASQKIPVILLSAHPSAAQVAKTSGATDFIAKPFDVDVLVSKVMQYTTT